MSGGEVLAALEMGLIYGIVAMGIYLTFRVIDFPDLTVDGSFVAGAAASAMMLQKGASPWGALVSAALAGDIAGSFTGILHVYGKIRALLAGIITAFILYSINLRLMGGAPNIALLEEPTIFSERSPLMVLSGIFISLWVLGSWLLKTEWGVGLRSIGQNMQTAKRYGVNVSRMTLMGLILSNSLIGFAGGLASQYQG
jgi:putative ABC transport system permease protein